jgi:anti-sigma B factor antagonist
MTRLAQQQAVVSSDTIDGRTEVITLDGEFDLSGAGELEQRLSAAFGPDQTNIVVDLRGVRFLDGAVLQVLLRGLTQAQEQGTRFGLIRPHALVWRVFVLTGLSERFPTHSSVREALSEG